MREWYIEAPLNLEHPADGLGKRVLAQERVDGHLAYQQYDSGLDELELALQKPTTEGDLSLRRRSVPVAARRLARETAGQRGQVDVRSEVARGEASPIEPQLEEAAGRPGKMVTLAVGHRSRCLPDQHEPRIVDQRWPDRV